MDERARGLTVALILVTAAALAVSFFASARAKGTHHRLQRLTQTNRSLKTELIQTQQRYTREATSVLELQTALAQERARNRKWAASDAQEQEAGKTNFQTR